ncbi:Ribosomal protein L7/L12 C-terminal domain-containing protein [Microbulbifer donghaiensis]|uniref:Ribosomal protein L7/L12 C-terminal domain-containing protein n=1 Tax=Microbulbifer donghaiensis TaxID=494016 RepID=A0A1M4YJV4_9GAMM|nr:hypothetical protein [Microbulbifer donghaiensis]SHF06021.1 Ribosomal protein L7/L12 C-terminal domain-containing protein [Microbulbifer donghaiensis]
MSQPTYSLIFRGDLVPGFTAADVKAHLARLFKAGPETIDKLFNGRPLAIKKGLAKAQAEQLQATLAKLGAQVVLKAEGEVDAPPAPAPQADEAVSSPVSAGADWSLAPMEGNLVKEHEREKKQAVQVSVDHLSLKPAQGNLIEEGERSHTQAVTVEVPDWKLD